MRGRKREDAEPLAITAEHSKWEDDKVILGAFIPSGGHLHLQADYGAPLNGGNIATS